MITTTLPEPRVTTKVVYRYEFDLAPIRVSATDYNAPYICTRIDVTIERDSDIVGGTYVDYDCYGYAATKTGVRDLRSKLTTVWLDEEYRQPYVDDAMYRFMGHK